MDIIDQYLCCICTELMIRPWKIKTCSHNACEDCVQSLLNTNPSCPVCRKVFTKDNTEYDSEFADKINNNSEECICGEKLSIPQLKKHMEECKQVLEETEKAKANLLDKSKMKKTVNRATFTCPICKTPNLTRDELLKHTNDRHPQGKAVCPICAAQPWGDPNHKTHLNAHLQLRHQYSYDTYTDYDNNDDDILKQVLELSKQEQGPGQDSKADETKKEDNKRITRKSKSKSIEDRDDGEEFQTKKKVKKSKVTA